ncbi:hypothetical protein ES703_122257 [subsurface metagenome]
MIDIVRYLLDWPRDSKGEVIFSNSHEAIFYAILVHNAKALAEEIEALRIRAKLDLEIEKNKPDGNPDLMIYLSCKHSFYRECIDTAKKLLQEEVR